MRKTNKILKIIGFIFLVMAVIPTSAQARLIVQKGTSTIAAGQTTYVQSINAVSSLSNAFVLMWSTGDSGASNSQYHQATGVLTSTSQITFTRQGTTDDCRIGWYVIEAEYGEFEVVKRNTITIGTTATTQDDAIGATIDQSRSFIVSNSRIGGNGGTANAYKGYATTHFLNDTTIQAARGVSGTYTTIVSYAVVQWSAASGVTVQSKELSASIGTTEVTDTINTAVTPVQTWLYATARHNSNGLSQTAVNTYLKDGTTVGFSRYTGTYTSAIRWWAIQFPEGVPVQRQSLSAASGDLTEPATLASNVTIGYSWSDNYNDSNGTGTAYPRQSWYSQITAVNQVIATRYYSGQAANLSMQAIDTSAWIPPLVTITITPDPCKAVGIGGLETKLVFNLTMNTSVEPIITYDPQGATGPQACTAGTWSTTTYANDTYTVYNDYEINASTGDGTAVISVSGAKSDLGITMYPDTDDSFIIDATVPNNPSYPCGSWDSSSKTAAIPNDTWQEIDSTPYFEWTGASDGAGTGVSGYSVYWGNSSIGEPATTQEQSAENYDVATPVDDGIYYLRVRTFDNAGNYSEPVTIFIFQYDASAPINPDVPANSWESNLKLTPITNDTWQKDDNTPYFEWTGANDSGGSGVSGYSVYWGTDTNGEPGQTQQQSNMNYQVSTPADTNTYYLRVRTFDNFNHYSNPVTLFIFKYDDTQPTNPVQPCSGWDSPSKGNMLSNNKAQGFGQTPYFEWTGASDASGSGVSGYSIYWGMDSEGEPGLTQEQANADYEISTPTGEDTYYLIVRTFDALGNYSEPVTLFTFIYDETKPTVTITVSPDPAGHSAAGELEFKLVFSESMDIAVTPSVSYDPQGATGNQTVDTNGAWSTTTYTNDTYTVYNSNVINSTTGDGAAAISVSTAQDVALNTMLADTNDSFTIDTLVHHFVIAHDGMAVINIPETLTITAKNSTNCTVLDYTGQVTLSTLNETGEITWALVSGAGVFNDNGAGQDTATYTFAAGDNGVVTIQITDTNADNLDVEVTDTINTDDDTEGNLVVSTIPLGWFVISHDTAAIAGTPETITVTAKDINGQTKTDYAGTINLDTNGTATTITWGLSSGLGIFADGGASLDTAAYTFHDNDNGVAVFTIKDTKVETINISVEDNGKTDNDTEGNLIVSPGAVNSFIIAHDTQATAGIADNVSITAYDTYSNIKTNYTGTITVDTNGTTTTITWANVSGLGMFNDGGAGVDTATYTYAAGDNGTVTLSITDTKTESIDIDASASGKTDNDSEGNMLIVPAAIDYFVISHDGAASAGVSDQMSVTAKDAYANIKTNYTGTITLDTNGTATTIDWALVSGSGVFNDNGASVDTSTYTFDAADNGTAIFSILDTTQESINISVIGDTKTDDNTEGDLNVGPAVIWLFDITHDGNANAGVYDDVTITAKDSLGNIMTNYTGTITVDTNGTASAVSWAKVTGLGTFNDGGASVDTATYTYASGDNGVVVLKIKDNVQESINISVSGDGRVDNDTEGNLIVGLPLLSHFVIAHDGAAAAGTAENIIITAKDTVGNTKTDYTGTITVDTNGTETAITWAKITGAGVFVDGGVDADTATYAYAAGDNGVVTLSINDTKVETVNISITGDGKTDDNTEGDLAVSPGALDHFKIVHDSSGIVNIAEMVTVSARDSNDNIKTNYTGTITLDTNGTATAITWGLQSGSGVFTDGGASVDTATYTFNAEDNGAAVFRVTDSIAQTINIAVFGDTKPDDNTEGNLVIGAAGTQTTGWLSPTANTGGFTNPTEAYADGGSYAYSRSGYEHQYSNYGFSFPYNAIITGIQIRLDAWGQRNGYSYSGELSWDAGTNFTSSGWSTPAMTTSQVTYLSANDLWGRTTWSKTELANANFRVKLIATGSTLRNNYLDWVPINVSYEIGANAAANNVTTADVGVGSSGNLILNTTVTNSASVQDTVTSITVNNTGTATDAEITSVKLYYDSNNSNDYTPGVDTQIGSGTFSSGAKTFSGLNINIAASGGNEYFFVIMDVASSAVSGHTLDAVIPANGITLTKTGTIEPTQINSSGNRIIKIMLDHFVISHDGAGIAGSNETVTVTAKDAFNNTKTDYTGQITLDTTGTPGTISWSLQSGNGVFNDGGASVDTATYTFNVADNGTVTFSVNDTLSETFNISISGDGKTDDNTEGNLVVAPAGIDHFVISHDTAAIAGIAEQVSVTAKDAYSNTITNYAAQITLNTTGTANTITWALISGFGTFVDGGASVDTATYTFSPSDNGQAVFTVMDNTAETINISVIANGKFDDDTEGNLVVAPAGIDYFVINHDGTAIAGTPEQVTITAKDALGNTKIDYTGQITVDTTGTATTITWALQTGSGAFVEGGASVDSATYTYNSADNGVVVLTLNDTKKETVNISVSGDTKTDDNTEGNLVVSPGAIDYFVISHDGVATTGVSESVGITAYDANDNIKDDYIGQITIDTNGTPTTITWTLVSGDGEFVDSGASDDTATYTYVLGDNGTVSLSIVDYTSETINISVTGDGKTDDNTEGDLQIASSGIDHFLISHDNNALAGTPENITIYAKNANNDTLQNYQGQITIDTSGTPSAISWILVSGNGIFADGGVGMDTATYTFTDSDDGTVVLSIIDTAEETLNISVSGEGKTDDNTEGNLVINPVGLHHFTISHDGAAFAGVADAVTIIAKDANNNTVTNYTGQITVDTNGTATAITWAKQTGSGSFAEGGPSVDTATYTFVSGDNGQCVLTITDNKVETINISVSGSGKSDDNTEGNLIIGPGTIDHFVISHDSSAVAGIADNVTIIAYDAYNNIKTNYTGQITLDTNGTAATITWAKVTGAGVFVDGGASVDTATYTYVAGDNGQCVLSINDTTAETLNISVAGDGKNDNDSEGNLVVMATTVDHFVIMHDNSAEAGVAESVSITAYDAYNNIKTDYTGQITVDTNGTATTITWAKVSGAGSFVDGGASVDTATYTYASGDNGVVGLTISDTKKETININVSGDGKVDTNTEGNLVVGPTGLDHFVISHDTAAIAGVADNVSITAFDTYSNLKDNYTGTITVDTNGTADAITWAKVSGAGSFEDGGASVDTATYTYAAADNGVVTLSIADTKTETIDIDAQAAGKYDDDSEANMVIGPSDINDFVVSHDTQGVVNSAEPITVTARDIYQNIKTDYTGQITVSVTGESGEITWALAAGSGLFNDAGAGLDTATYTYNALDLGLVGLTITDNTADTINIVVSGDGKSDENNEGNLSFTSSYIVIDNLDSGYSENTVDNDWTTRTTGNEYGTNWRRDTTRNDGDWARWTPNITIPGNYEVFAFWSDLGTANATDSPYTVYYNGGNSGALDQNQEVNGNQWNSLGVYEFAVGTGGYVQLGDAANDDVCADAIKFELKGSAAAAANSVDSSSVGAGASDVLILDVTVSNNAINNDTITSVTVNNIGTISDAEIAAVKLYYDSNNSQDYTPGTDVQVGTGTFSSAAKTFSNLNITLTGSGTEKLFVVLDLAQTVDDGDSLDVQIPANGIILANAPDIADAALNSAGTRTVSLNLDHFVISHDGAAAAGIPEQITVTAKDEYENVIIYYTGTITLDTNGTAASISWSLQTGSGVFNDNGAGVDTATYAFNAADSGVAVFNVTDNKAETINISVSGNGKTDNNTEGNLIVAPAGLDHFVITHDASAIAGIADNVTVTAKDAYENTVYDYTGSITLDTNGTANAIEWALVVGFGTFNDNGAGVDTATYTFSASDNSTATFTITDTQSESLNISVSDGIGHNDNNSEGNLVVSAANLHHFVISHDGNAEAGVADNITIIAKDQYENTLTNYSGQITIDTDGTVGSIAWAKVSGSGTFVDGGIDADTATYTYNTADMGVVILSITDTTLENLNISVTGDGKNDDNTESTLNVGPGLIEYFTITHDGFALQNQAENITIKAYDAYNNIKTDYAGQITLDTNGTADAITWALITGNGTFNDNGPSVDTATYTFNTSDNGEVILSITDATAEIINVSVTAGTKTDDDNEGILEIVAAGFHHFKISHDGNAVNGVPEAITITAKDASDITITNYAGIMTVDTSGTATTITWALQTGNGTFNDGGSGVDTAEYTFDALDNGVVILTITDTTLETININCFGSGKTDDNTEGNLVINPAGLNHFTITHDHNAVAGVAENIVISAEDANNTAVSGYTGTINLDTNGTAGAITWANIDGAGIFSDGGAVVDTATYTFASGDLGNVTLSINDTKAEMINISVTGDGKTDDDQEGNLTISHGVIDHFIINHDQAAEAGTAENITITAKDVYNNIITDYTSQITVDTTGTPATITWALTTGSGIFNDGGAGVDTATYTYQTADNGVVVLNITDTTVESINISVTGDGKLDDNTEGNLSVGAGTINKFVVTHDGNAQAGSAESVIITAYDIYNNIKTNYTGTITLDTNGTANSITWALSSGLGSFNDGGVYLDTATYGFVSADNGTAEFTITDTKAEIIDIDVSGNGKFDDDTEGNLIIAPSGLDHFFISHDGNAQAGVSENIIIQAQDYYDNIQTDYTGQITVDTNGTETAITWALITGSGTFNDHGVSIDTATYTFAPGDNGAVTLSINDTKAEDVNISVSGDSKFDDDTEGNLTVKPNVLNYFIVAHDNEAIQGVGEEITVTAKDSYANTKTDYTGTITLDTNGDVNNISWSLNTGSGTFNDGGASVDTATYTYAVGDAGVASFNLTDDTAQTINISVNDGGITDENNEGDLVIQASSLTIDAVVNALSSGYIGAGTSGQLVLDLTLTNNNVLAADTIQTLTINNTGTISDAQVQTVKLYYDSNNSNSYTVGIDTQAGTGSFSSGTLAFTNINIQISAAGTEELYVVVDLTATVTNAVTVDVSVPINGITFTNSPDTDDVILNSSGIFTVDSGIPGIVSGLSSTSHSNAISAWNNPQSRDNTVSVNWSPATDPESGVDGYSVLWDTNPTTLPNTTKDIEQTQTTVTSTALSDGTVHYFHIRSVDNVGNWSSTAAHLGPFYIDTQGPASASIYQITELAGQDYLYVTGNTIYYSGNAYSAFNVYVSATDTGSGLKQAQFPTTISAGGIDSTVDTGAYQFIYTYVVSAAGATYNNTNVIVYDNAGNSANVPFNLMLDNTPPALVSNLTSSTHTVGISSSDNDITFTWSDVSDAQSGVAGYSFTVDTSSSTLPPKYRNINTGVQSYAANDLLSGNHYAHIRPVDRVGNWTAQATHAGAYIIGRGQLSASINASSNVISTDQEFTVTMTVENTGSSTINSVDILSLTLSSTSGATATTVSNPNSQDIGPTQQRNFPWTYTAGSTPGTVNFTGYAQGSDSEGSIISSTVTSSDIVIENRAALIVSVNATPSTVNTSQTITIAVTVSNTGQAQALNVAPSLIPSGSASPSISTGPSPSTATVNGGQSQTFTYTATASSAGTAIFTANIASGLDENSNAGLTATNAQDSVTVEAAPTYALTSSIAAAPQAANVAGTITVTMNVQNTGTDIINNIAPSGLSVGGSSSDAIYVSGPVPANVSSLISGATQNFVWTYTAGTTLGTVTFSGNAQGTEAVSTATISNAVTIQAEAAALSSSISATPTSLLSNATITITMTVNNTAGSGGATAENVSPSILTLGGTSAQANLLTGPTPASANINAASSQNFIWTYRAGTTAGTVNFTGNASGIDGNSQSTISSTATTSNNVTISTLNPEWMYPTGTDIVGPVRSIPIAYWGMYNKIYFGSDDHNLYILDGDTHGLDFSYTTSGVIRGLPYPSTDVKGEGLEDIVYFGTLGRTVYGIWADNSLRFERILGEELSTTVLYDYVSNIYFGTTANRAYCIDAADGTDVWSNPATVGGPIESSPAMIFVPTLDYDEIYFGATDGKIYAFKAADGTGARTFDTGFGAEADIKTAPVISLQNPSNSGSRRLMFFGTGNGRFYCVNTANLSASTADTGWATNPVICGDKVYSAPWVDVDTRYVYFGCQDGKLYALSLNDGSSRANFPVNIGSPIDSWPLVENGICYFGADDGKFYAVNINTGQIVPGWPYDTGAPIKSGAALHVVYDTETWEVIDTYVLVGSDSGKIYSFKVVQ
ncbi:MAG: PQQ-binding-like beta-propeller repeat protein [Candidatus Omnitrophota bacterium]